MKPQLVAILVAIFLMGLPLAQSAETETGKKSPSEPVRIEVFSPEGSVRDIRQVTARFSSPMVALGDPRLADPFVIDCPATGKGRWADGRNWVYDFDADLPAGVRCHFTLRQGLKALDGAPVADTRSFAFNTGGPAVLVSFPREGWTDIDEAQIFLLKLDAPATQQSIEANAHCVIDGVAERVPVKVLTGDARTAVLKARTALGYDYFEFLWKDGRTSQARVRNRTLDEAESLIVTLRCQRRLPPATQVQLRWGKGIATVSGIATTEDQQLAFHVRPAFVARVECTRTNPRAGCLPMLPITVNFGAPVPRAQALAIRLKMPDGRLLKPTSSVAKQIATVDSVSFTGLFPENVALTVILPAHLVDDAGRPLENAARFPLAVRVDDYPPLAKFSGKFGILESQEGGVLPVTLRNVEAGGQPSPSSLPAKMLRVDADPAAIATWLRRVEASDAMKGDWVKPTQEDIDARAKLKPKLEDEDDSGASNNSLVWHNDTGAHSVFDDTDATASFTVAKLKGKKSTELVGIPLKQPGFYVVELESRILGASLLGRDATRYVATSALVTNIAVHFKWGRESSRVWVTRLDTGEPVADADVTISNFCRHDVRWQGRTDRDGVATIDESLGEPQQSSYCGTYTTDRNEPLLVLAKKGGDFSFTQSSWSEGIGPREFSLRTGSSYDTDIFHTVLDRPLFHAGETVSMKHYLRRHYLQGMALIDAAPRTRKVVIAHQGSGQTYEFDVDFGADDIAEQQWKIPEEAKLGDYSISIADDSQRNQRETARFKVQQFRLPSMHASVSGSARALVHPKDATLDLHVAYLSGGGAAGLAVKVRSMVEPQPMTFPGYDDYQFGGKIVKEGVETSANTSQDYDFESGPAPESGKAQVVPVTLDDTGSARVTIPNLPQLDDAAQLMAELEYADANGEILTASGRVRLAPSALTVGIRREGWVASAEQMRFRVLVLDLDGKPSAQQSITVALFQSKSYSYRKRLIGGFYAYETTRDTHRLAASCQGQTNAQGIVLCEMAPGVSGEIMIRAETRDAQGNLAGATASIWVAGKDDWWFGGTSGDRMDLMAEKKEYEVGDKARFQVRMPFRAATALVTVEREGVVSSFVTHLNGQAPVIEVPIENTYAPNVFVSVLAVRGRVASAKSQDPKLAGANEITSLVDLNKPAYRLGMAEIKVGWKPHRLNVSVTPERSTYQVRDTAHVKIHVTRADGNALPQGTEVAVAAIDEALLELAPNPSWALLDAMMGERGLEVLTSTAQMQVVGKRHYGRKAVPHGGGGGRDKAREQFDSLLFWKSRLVLDANGDTNLAVPLNDSLSSFRIVAVAHGGAQLFGTGSASINTTQDLVLVSGLPPLVREGDRFAATFTLRNTTDRTLKADVAAALTPASVQPLDVQHVEIPGGQARDLVWQVSAPVGSAQVQWEVNARQLGGVAGDKLKIVETVIPAYAVRTYQATIEQLTSPLTMPAQRPAGAVPGRGGLEVTLRAKLGDGLDGVHEYMSLYPYICLEQELSRAVALRDRQLWDTWMQRLPAYMDKDGLLKYFPSDRLEGDDSLTAYVLAIADESGWPILESHKDRLLHALSDFVDGKIVRRSALPTADLAIRKLAAIDALSRYAAAKSRMLDSITIEPNLWPTSALIDWLGILKRVNDIPQSDERRNAALIALRARLNFQGTIMTFSTERSDALWWLMISSDSNANRMLLATIDLPEWREDIPRLVRGALGRQQFGHWNTTVANAWGVLAMEKFSAAFESVPVDGQTAIHYGAAKHTVDWPQQTGSSEVDLPWQEGKTSINVEHAGTGKPWVMIRARAALPLDKPLSSGFKVVRTVTPVEQHAAGRWTRGDVVRVRLELEAQSDMSWVVVDDPIPAGASILGSGLGGQSDLLTRGERSEGWAWLAFEERRFDAFRSYYRLVPKGHWVVEYSVRLNNPGTFQLPATRVEAMYAPEMFGETPNATMTVEASP